MKRALLLSLLALVAVGQVACASTSKSWVEVEIEYTGHATVEPRGSLIDVGHFAGTEKLYWGARDRVEVARVQMPLAPYTHHMEVVVDHTVWAFSAKDLQTEWSAWKLPNGSAQTEYKIGKSSEAYTYELLRAQAKDIPLTALPEGKATEYQVRYRVSNKAE